MAKENPYIDSTTSGIPSRPSTSCLALPCMPVSQLLNHKDPTVIRRYAHLSPDFRKQVTEKTAQLSEGWLSLLRYHQDGTSGKRNQ